MQRADVVEGVELAWDPTTRLLFLTVHAGVDQDARTAARIVAATERLAGTQPYRMLYDAQGRRLGDIGWRSEWVRHVRRVGGLRAAILGGERIDRETLAVVRLESGADVRLFRDERDAMRWLLDGEPTRA